MRYVIIFVVLLAIFILGYIMGGSSEIAKTMDFTAGTLHIDKDFDYIWQFEFKSDASLEECKKHKFVTFKVDKDAKLSQ